MGEITIVGLGPGPFRLLTVETLDLLSSGKTVLLRTAKHPAVDECRQRNMVFTSYDHVYEEKGSFDEVYQTIAADCLQRAEQGEDIVFAVPGSPLVAEKTVTLLRQQGEARGIRIRILPGMSFLEVLYTRLGIDPIHGLTVLDAADIATLLPAAGHTGLVVTQVYNRQVASDAKLSLMERYADEHPVTLVRNLGLDDEEVLTVPLYELDRVPVVDHLTSVYVPQAQAATSFSFHSIVDVMAKLRSPGGCPWDVEQDHASLRRCILEEVYEVLEAIDQKDSELLREELGDLLLQIVFHARIAEEYGQFSLQDVIDDLVAKLIRRHPHVFGSLTVEDAAEVLINWEAIKREEKAKERKSVLDGIPPELPALLRAAKLQSKAAKVGFDWDTIEPVWGKISEELSELRQAVGANDPDKVEDELGDVLFAVVNLARFLHVDGEIALNRTNNKFVRRFSYIEQRMAADSLSWDKLSLADLDVFWEEAKLQEKNATK